MAPVCEHKQRIARAVNRALSWHPQSIKRAFGSHRRRRQSVCLPRSPRAGISVRALTEDGKRIA
eukprot:56408-Lingulodinium_polyedra.AAC.1